MNRPEPASPLGRRALRYNTGEMGVVVSREELLQLRERWRADGCKVVFTNGCYDLIHPGHVRVLERSRAKGDKLIVAINSDRSVRELKGPLRPILPQAERAAILASFEAVDAVTVFDEETPCPLLEKLLPDALCKGADWSHWIAGREIVEEAGGEVFALPLEEGFSTTDVVKSALEQRV